ncbi:MAG: alpha/beta hydrolase [Salinisphaera sp.]|nr:alpha/beta hydrolase [Salinisphaera sp.]
MLTATRKPFRRYRPEAPTMAIGTLERQTVELPMGRVAYLRHGSGLPLLLVHGIPTSARLWEPLLGLLGEHYDCIVPDLLGLGRSVPNANADLASPGQADMLAALLDELGVEQCHVVFHDQGGAHGGQMLKYHGARIDAVVFTDIVCYDNWLVPLIAMINALGRGIKPLAATRLLQTSMRFYPWTRVTTRDRLPAAIVEDWQYALNHGGQALDDWIRYCTAQSPYWTQDAVPTLKAWDKPASVLWAAQDEFLPVSWALQLARDLPTADDQPTLLPFAGHFWQMEVAQTGAQAIHRFFAGLNSTAN